MKNRFSILLMSIGAISFSMDKTGLDDQFYPALHKAIKNNEYENARLLFNLLKTSPTISPMQLSDLIGALHSSDLQKTNPQFYYQISAFVSIYTDALNGTLAFNDYYLRCFKR